MSEVFTNETGCEVSVSHITGDVVCQIPGPECDCLIVSTRNTYKPASALAAENGNLEAAMELAADEIAADEAAGEEELIRFTS